MRALKRMISAKTSRAALLVSIDNFYNYKENYTQLASDKLIQTYWAIIKSTIEEDDYFGEIEENIFLIITDSEKAEAVANYLIYAFETVSAKFYSIEDNKRGYMMMKGDNQAGRRSNFAHSTIGVVSNEFVAYKDAAQLYNALVRIHKLAKIPSKSNYLIERPQISGGTVENFGRNNQVFICEKDDALRILLKTILDLQGYDAVVCEADEGILEMSAPALIILDAGELEVLSGLELCQKIKNNQNFINTKIILTSILHDKELVLNSGADLYLPKPYELSGLIKWVDKLLD